MMMRRMNVGDIAAVGRLLQDSFARPWTLTVIKNTLDRKDAFCLVAEEDGGIVGFLAFEKILDEGSVELIAVEKQHRRRGIARGMLTLAMSAFEDLRTVTLEVRRSNMPAIALYESLGFSQIAVRKNYYAELGEDALVMQKQM